MNVQEDIQKFIRLMLAEKYDNQKFRLDSTSTLLFFNKPYMFSNEYLHTFMSQLGINGKTVLTTGSSGDQILFSQLYGAKRVTCFDINPFSKYIYALKAAYIKKLSYQQFYNMVTNKHNGFNEMLNPDNYEKIADNLEEECRYFWDNVFDAGLNTDTSIFTHTTKIDVFKCRYVSDALTYNNLKAALASSNCDINFITCDIRDLPSSLAADDKYDVVLLSNIYDYHYMLNKYNKDAKTDKEKDASFVAGKKVFKQIVETLAQNNLNTNGKIQIGYRYNECGLREDDTDKLFNPKKLSICGFKDYPEAAIVYTPSPKLTSGSNPPEPPQFI